MSAAMVPLSLVISYGRDERAAGARAGGVSVERGALAPRLAPSSVGRGARARDAWRCRARSIAARLRWLSLARWVV